jgi:hypothetical protein
MSRQETVNEKMRCILIDWLVWWSLFTTRNRYLTIN